MTAGRRNKTVSTVASRIRDVAMVLLLCGCTTAAIENVAPAQPVARDFAVPGDYPNLNVVPTPAAAQFTEEEKTARMEDLRARRAQLAGEAQRQGVRDRSAELRRLGRTHADDTLKEIAAQ